MTPPSTSAVKPGVVLAWLGRWINRYAYNSKTWTDIEHQGHPSKWVTLGASTVLRAAYG